MCRREVAESTTLGLRFSTDIPTHTSPEASPLHTSTLLLQTSSRLSLGPTLHTLTTSEKDDADNVSMTLLAAQVSRFRSFTPH